MRMQEIGGDSPVFLSGFASECLAGGTTIPQFTPINAGFLQSFQSHRSTIVDLACKEDGASYYSGDHRERQSIDMSFGDFLDYFTSAFRGQEHWLGSVDGLQFYLCQCPIAVFKPDETCAGPILPRIMEHFRMYVTNHGTGGNFVSPNQGSAVSPSLLPDEQVTQVNLWMAVEQSRTGIHYDAYQNVLVVLHGKKTLKLYPPSQTKNLYPRPIYSRSSNHSSVNFTDPDLSTHVDFTQAEPIVMEALAGDAVYIPEGWWHQVDSEPFTIAVNIWFDGIRDQLVRNTDMSVYYARVVMEDLVRAETSSAILKLRTICQVKTGLQSTPSPSQIAEGTMSQQARESLMLSMSEDDLAQAQIVLASEFPSVWKDILINATDEFAAFLTDFWDRLADEAHWVPTVFGALGDDNDGIKHGLLNKHERFKQKICSQVITATLGI